MAQLADRCQYHDNTPRSIPIIVGATAATGRDNAGPVTFAMSVGETMTDTISQQRKLSKLYGDGTTTNTAPRQETANRQRRRPPRPGEERVTTSTTYCQHTAQQLPAAQGQLTAAQWHSGTAAAAFRQQLPFNSSPYTTWCSQNNSGPTPAATTWRAVGKFENSTCRENESILPPASTARNESNIKLSENR